MGTGIVKWYNPTKGFAFIQPDEGDSDFYVEASALNEAGISGLLLVPAWTMHPFLGSRI